MKSVRVATEPAYDVRIGAGLLSEIEPALRTYSRHVLLTDRNVEHLYADALRALDGAPLLAVEPGETSKSLVVLERVLDFLADAGLDRRGCLVLVGGGVVGDLGALAASLYMRGIDFMQVPTTLLAQVDSSVGGKTAVNLRAGKNLAGTFHQPRLVLADVRTLATLSDDEYRSGLGEVVKSALIEGDGALAYLEAHTAAILLRDPDVLTHVVESCVRTKAAIVARDPRETGERKVLNLGHTFAHAIEHAAGFGTVPHGIGVAAGIALSLEMSRELGMLTDPDLPERVVRLMSALALPHSLRDVAATYRCTLETKTLASAMHLDKKSSAGQPRFVLAEQAGRVRFDVSAQPSLIESLLARS